MTPDVALTILRIVVGLVFIGHGAQKVLGAWGGPGMQNWTNMVAQMGFRPAALWAAFGACAELLGGLALVLGILTPIVAAVLVVDMIVAISKVHWRNGFWMAKGGYEYPLTLAIFLVALGLAGPGAWALDAAVGLTGLTTPLFLVSIGVALVLTIAAMQPAPGEEEHRRRAA